MGKLDMKATRLWAALDDLADEAEFLGEERTAAHLRTIVRQALEDVGMCICQCGEVVEAGEAWDFPRNICAMCRKEYEADVREEMANASASAHADEIADEREGAI